MNTRRVSLIKVIPSASRLVNSLRDLGYDFPQAVADLVDNSVTAGANRISVDLCFQGPESWLRIIDDGHGMSGQEITEAMRYGSQQAYEEEDLGKFGLGLKTASLSQSRRLSVASRCSKHRNQIEVRQLDLDHVVDADRWEIFVLDGRSGDQRVVDPLQKGPGTVVLWESLDRLLGYKIPWGKRAQSALDVLADQLSLHLGMIFHRFLAGEVAGRRKVRIAVNGRRVQPWDPFARDEPATLELPACEFDIETDEGVGLVRFEPFVLPARERFSTEENFHHRSGPRKWNAQQGFYIYRANRMIQSGGWCRMRALDEHVKLARAAIDFYPDLDSAFEINVAKVRAVLPAELKERLQRPVESLVRAAQNAYREHSSDAAPVRSANLNRRKALEAAAKKAGEQRALRKIVKQIQEAAPKLAKDLGW